MSAYIITWADGREERHDTYRAALTSIRVECPGVEIGHPDDLMGGGDRTLAWARDEDARDDAGLNAVAVIRRAVQP